MAKQSALELKRKEVRDEILAMKEKTLSARILNFFGRAFEAKTTMFWLSNVIFLNLIFFTPWALAELLLKENINVHISTLIIIALEFGVMGFITSHIVVEYIIDTAANRIVEKIDKFDDLIKFLYWFKKSLSVREVLIFVLPFWMVWTFVAVFSFTMVFHIFIGVGPSLAILLGWLLGAIVCHVPYWVSLLAFHLRNYQYDLNAFSPADSEIINVVSDMLTKCIYILATYFAIATLIVSSNLVEQQLKIIFALPFFLIIWTTILVQFLITRSTLASIASTAKWRTLNKLQIKINAIEAKGDLSDKDTSERLLRLADIHKQIMASKTQIFDLTSISTLFSQLMLPLLGLLLGNLDKVIALFSK